MFVDHSSLPAFVPSGARVLVLGSFPSVQSRKAGFYYAHPTNRFFPVLAALFQEETPKTIPERKDFLARHKIALYDVLFSCEIEASKDSSIRHPVPIDLSRLMAENDFARIFTTGKAAERYFRKFFAVDFIPLPSTSAANAQLSFERLVESYRRKLLPFLC